MGKGVVVVVKVTLGPRRTSVQRIMRCDFSFMSPFTAALGQKAEGVAQG